MIENSIEVEDCTAHGGLVDDELGRFGLVPADVLDVSVNVNPYGPCSAVVDAVHAAPIARYPDPTATPARLALARWLEVPPTCVVVGNGAVDLLWGLVRGLVPRNDVVLIVEPAFSELRTAATHVGARIVEYRLEAANDFACDLDTLATLVATTRPRLVYLATPANPTGAVIPTDAVGRLATSFPDTLFVADLSFASLSEGYGDTVMERSERVVWVRSLTKDLALPGLRVGFGVMPPEVARVVESGRPPWSVNAMAQAAAVAATTLEVSRFVADSCARLLVDRVRLEKTLSRLGLRVHGSKTVYALAYLGPDTRATMLRNTMLARHAVLVRDCTSFGLPHHIRLGARPAGDDERLVRALTETLQQ